MLTNFDAGPATLPEEVLQQAAQAVLEYENSGLSILEIPHRGKLFEHILNEANELVRELLQLGSDYNVLWLQGGGRLQFSMIPMNFLKEDGSAGYIDSGRWAAEAIQGAQLYGNTDIIASSRDSNYKGIPQWGTIPHHLSYLHLTSNNTIYGIQFTEFPVTDVPLIADMSSELFSRVLDYQKFSLIYAVAQKNIGPAGVTLVVIHNSLTNRQVRPLPDILNYSLLAENNSLLNTPPVFAIYCSLLNLRWIKRTGMIVIEKQNEEKAGLLYQAIDESNVFYGVAERESRSRMNVCFRAYDEQHTQRFLDFALENGITGIKGHRSVGGFRVSLYNAIRVSDVKKLIATMKEFEKKSQN